jgi:hypothetical protein
VNRVLRRASYAGREENFMMKKLLVQALVAGSGFMLCSGVTRAEDHEVDWKALQGAKVSLEKGLGAAQKNGKPISGKFEVEDGALQLSTYTASKGKYSEVIVDHKTGKIARTEEIKEGDDLTHATAQDKAMSAAKTSLRSAVSKAVASNKGYRAVSAVPSLNDGKPIATIVLQNAKGTKTVTEKLD